MDDQLDLFRSSPKLGVQGDKMDSGHRDQFQVIPFPCKRRLGKARRAAEVLLKKKTDKARDAYWRDITGTIEWQMKRMGISDDIIQREVSGFYDLVSAVLASEQRGSDSA